MTPEQCVFCEIIAGKIKAAVIWESNDVIAIVDVRQAHAGHTLVIPKQHIRNIFELPDELAGVLMQATTRISRAVNSAFNPDGVSLWQSNGPGAHQEVPHLHIHIHPRWKDDTVLKVYAEKPDTPSAKVLEERAMVIRTHLEEISK
jgi:histidine triad (HIT) family protein|tara:strand:- start:97 stop:534 length:438 start_codon:yes stop_codon:yes gene_type:complete